MSDKKPLEIRGVLLGASGVGKSSILNTLNDTKIDAKDRRASTCNIFQKDFLIQKYNKTIKYIIFDLPGGENFRNFVSHFFKDSTVFILVYDITNKQSFEEFKNFWIDSIKTYKFKDMGK